MVGDDFAIVTEEEIGLGEGSYLPPISSFGRGLDAKPRGNRERIRSGSTKRRSGLTEIESSAVLGRGKGPSRKRMAGVKRATTVCKASWKS